MPTSGSSYPTAIVPNLSILGGYLATPTERPMLDPTVATSSALNPAMPVVVRYIIEMSRRQA